MLPFPSHPQFLPTTLTNILTNCDGVRLYLNGQLFDLDPQVKLSVLEYIFIHFPLLETLNLNNNNLETLPDSISNLTRLTHLELNRNKLINLPETLGNLTRLTSLFLNGNKLISLPESLGNLPQLGYLLLNDNKLTHLPDTLGKLIQLKTLSLSRNELTYLPETLGHLTQLTHLDLSENKLITLPDTLGNLIQLNYLGLNKNELTSLPLSIIELPDDMECHMEMEGYPLTFLPEWEADYTYNFKPLKDFLKCILSLDDIKHAKNFLFYSSLSKECYHLIKEKHLISEESNPNITAERSTKQIKHHQEAPAQTPAPNSSSTSQPMTEPPQEFHYFTQLPHDLSKKILLHAATIPASNHPQFMKGFCKHLSDKPSFNSLRCFLEEAVPDWKTRVRQNYEESQKTSAPYR